MNERTISSALRGSVVGDDVELTILELCRACRTSEHEIELWVVEGVLQPRGESRETWRFGGDALLFQQGGTVCYFYFYSVRLCQLM